MCELYSLGRELYQAYCSARLVRLPEWHCLTAAERDGWVAVAHKAQELVACKHDHDAIYERGYTRGYDDGKQAQKEDEEKQGTVLAYKLGQSVRVVGTIHDGKVGSIVEIQDGPNCYAVRFRRKGRTHLFQEHELTNY